ncbi:hypothetical protein ACU4GH_24560 [Bradyrhizobium betae]
MQAHVVGSNGSWRPIESIIDGWAELLVDFVFATIVQRCADVTSDHLQTIRDFLAAPDLRKKSEAYRAVWGPEIWDTLKLPLLKKKPKVVPPTRAQAMQSCIAFLRENKYRAVIIFDSMDEYEIGHPSVDRTIGGLLRFCFSVQQFERSHQDKAWSAIRGVPRNPAGIGQSAERFCQF